MYRTLLSLAILLCAYATFAQKPAAQPAPEFAVILHLTPQYQDDAAWKKEDIEAAGEHFAALQKLQAAGKLSFAGRTTNKASTGIIILKNMTEAEAKAVMDDDKAVRRGIMSAELQPFSTVLKEK